MAELHQLIRGAWLPFERDLERDHRCQPDRPDASLPGRDPDLSSAGQRSFVTTASLGGLFGCRAGAARILRMAAFMRHSGEFLSPPSPASRNI
jgi:hypothetical protein